MEFYSWKVGTLACTSRIPDNMDTLLVLCAVECGGCGFLRVLAVVAMACELGTVFYLANMRPLIWKLS